MAAELTFETSAQSTGQNILPELPRSLVTFRSTAYMDKVSPLADRPATQRWLSGESPLRGGPPQKGLGRAMEFTFNCCGCWTTQINSRSS